MNAYYFVRGVFAFIYITSPVLFTLPTFKAPRLADSSRYLIALLRVQVIIQIIF